jgi:hypothetical protein
MIRQNGLVARPTELILTGSKLFKSRSPDHKRALLDTYAMPPYTTTAGAGSTSGSDLSRTRISP